MAKHPAAEAWDSWLASQEGQDASEPGRIERQYLENRLHRAFMAGFNHGAVCMKAEVTKVVDGEIAKAFKKMILG